MDKWPHIVERWCLTDILIAVSNPDWQVFRLSLKGLPTAEKLERLDVYRRNATEHGAYCRVDNYINALRRGGQLNLNNEVQR